MSKWRLFLILFLFLAPFAVLIGLGSYHLWEKGWIFEAWWPMTLSLVAGYGLLWHWTRRKKRLLLPETGVEAPPNHWTERDKLAWGVVDQRVKENRTPSLDELADARRYADEALTLALDIARIYQPGTNEPFNHLTLPEIMTCAELVSEDLARKVNQYIIGSHLLTVGQWRKLRQYKDWGQRAWDMSWLARIVLSPIKAGSQFIASKAGGSVLTHVQNNVLAWFHAAYVHELGRYLIELNSGRLKVGAKRYRELVQEKNVPAATVEHAGPLTVAVVGSANADKMALILTLLGDDRAAAEVTLTDGGETDYLLRSGDLPPLKLIDVPAYSDSERDLRKAVRAVKDADLLLLTTLALSEDHNEDKAFLAQFQVEWEATPGLRPPPLIIALDRIDGVFPENEWSPPYDWRTGKRTKEQSMRDAVAAAAEQLGNWPIVPVNTNPERNFNREELLGAIAANLDAARGGALLRLLHAEAGSGSKTKTLSQALSLGREALAAVWASVKPK